MLRQYRPNLIERFDQRLTELLVPEMRANSLHDVMPEFVAALLVNRFVANHRKLVNTRGDKNKHGIVLAGLVHPEPVKIPLRGDERITVQLSTLDQNANFTGGF